MSRRLEDRHGRDRLADLNPDPLTGGIFLAQQNENPFGSTFAIYVATEADGVLIKLAGDVHDRSGDRSDHDDVHQQPAAAVHAISSSISSAGRGRRSPRRRRCGSFTTTSDVHAVVVAGVGRGRDSVGLVRDHLRLRRWVRADVHRRHVNPQAGAFSPFELSFSRSDSDQDLSGLTVNLPPGVSAKLAGVPECSEAEIAQAQDARQDRRPGAGEPELPGERSGRDGRDGGWAGH